jgi:hypothetical protein
MLSQADSILRGELLERESPSRALPRLILVLLACGIFYGMVMGSYGGLSPHRALQPVYSGVKVPILLLLTFALSLPSFFVLNTLLGLRDDFHVVLRALVASQAGLTVVLASLAPFTAFWYLSVGGYDLALLFNAAMFAVASAAGQLILRRFYRPLIARNPRHRNLMRLWLVIYAFVGIQMGWVLRPFIGNPGSPTTFFRAEAWGNAYVEVTQITVRAISGH